MITFCTVDVTAAVTTCFSNTVSVFNFGAEWVVNVKFLGVFAKLRKSSISFVMPVRLSVRMEQLAYYWTDFHEIWYLRIFRISVEKIQVSLQSDKNIWYCT